jgi:predicted nucleotidyltransferase
VILVVTLMVGFVLGFGAATRGPAFVAPYLPKSVSGPGERLEGQVVRKQRDGNRLLVKIVTAQGPMLVSFTQKASDLDVLIDPAQGISLLTLAHLENEAEDLLGVPVSILTPVAPNGLVAILKSTTTKVTIVVLLGLYLAVIAFRFTSLGWHIWFVRNLPIARIVLVVFLVVLAVQYFKGRNSTNHPG